MKPIQTYSTFSGEMVELKELKKRIKWLEENITEQLAPAGFKILLKEAFEGIE